MRHIPEDELHAYLDQALSRSQCIEIETHLARCPVCHGVRDTIAALRDRTTALLAGTAPAVRPPPPIATLLARAEAKRRHSWRRTALLAASFGGAILAGWGMRAALDPHHAVEPAPLALTQPPPTPETMSASSAVQAPVAESDAIPGDRSATTFAPTVSRDVPIRLAADLGSEPLGGTDANPLDDVVSHQPVVLRLDGEWRTAEATSAITMLPVLDGAPIREVQVHDADGAERPLVIVTQPHSSGALFYTVEGPSDRVAEFVRSQLAVGPEGLRSSDPSRSPPDYIEMPTGGVRRTHRTLAVLGTLSLDTLNAVARRITIR